MKFSTMKFQCQSDGIRAFGFVAAAFLLATAAHAADWGTIKGRILLDGDAPTPVPIQVTKDTEFCGNHKLVEETVVVGDDGGLANAFIYLYVKRGKSVDIHPDYDKNADTPLVLNNIGCRFEPRALLVYTKHTLEIHNDDQGIAHNTNATLVANSRFNNLISNDSPFIVKFEKSEPVPAPFGCNIHPWMTANVLIRTNPYMAVTGKDGNFEIKNVPAGKHDFIFWHEAVGNLRDLKIGDDKTNRKGRLNLTVAGGETIDLGEIKVAASVLGK